MKILLFLFMSTWLTGCQAAQYQDDSSAEKYSGLVGNTYQTLDDFLIHGVTHDKNYEKVIDEYVVTNRPGFGGPEVIERTVLRAGAVIRINKVLRCTSCAYSGIKYVIEISPSQTDSLAPISLKAIGGEKIAVEKSGRLVMNPKLFKRQ